MFREEQRGSTVFGRKKRHIVRLLLVEDEPLVAFDNEHCLSDAGFEIVGTVDRVAAALVTLGNGDGIDLVVADVRLADGSGVEVARAAHAVNVPVLFVTGSRPDGAEMLAEGWLAKPYAPKDLVGAIQAVEARIEGKSQRRLPLGLELFGRVQV
ncbi:response regulator transcription factor [Sphingomonas sp.]|jgi:DNA-binding response OmpR family regulator|uniref:response regulator transcription factor n=1 Tax=Sphingomonas sp. TaxID=28214 RepID=UPI002D80BCF1|nr:response regulator [Sphingomonas sp.]HEU0045119.1 response regulator [Sphingomonas sp.]